MYNKSAPFAGRVFRSASSTIENIPFEDVSRQFTKLINASYAAWLSESEKAKTRYVHEYNQTHEDSYEGDFDFLNLPNFQGMSAPHLTEFNEFLVDFASKHSLITKSGWLFPQMLAKFGELPISKNSNGLYSAETLLNKHIKPDPILAGMWAICRHAHRSTYLKSQTDPTTRNYSALVPLIMSAFKKYQNIPYSAWERSEIIKITEPNLAAAMLCDLPKDMNPEEILTIRCAALTPKSGPKMGEMRSPATSYVLYVPKDTIISDLPTLAKIMVCQTWCAHPTNRTEYTITNPSDWDNAPDILVGSGVIVGSNVHSDVSAPKW